jgi:two-component system sensor histidine kinase MprB
VAAAIAVAIAVVLVAVISYFVVRDQLVGQVDNALRAEANLIEAQAGLGKPFPTPPASVGGPAPYAWIVTPDGSIYQEVLGDPSLPQMSRVTAVAAGQSPAFFTNVRIGNSHLRIMVFETLRPGPVAGQTIAVVLARPLNGIDHVLSILRLILFLVCLGGIALAAVLGRLAANRVLAPLADVAATAQHVSETEDLSSRIHVQSDDEVGQLATRFNAMIERLQGSRDQLDESVRAQRQLVADASHELRTPITSLRTNIELLLEHEDLDPEERRRILADVVEQTEELGALISDLIELSRGDFPDDSYEDLRLDQLVRDSVHRAERNFPQIAFWATLAPMVVEGNPDRLSRAVNNLLDNAARHSPPGGVVEVTLDGGGVRVRDHGPGVAQSDLPYVFDRFYRGAGARGRHGSGLGLSIVRQVAEQHRGSVSVENAPDGGAVFTLALPAAPHVGAAPADASGSGRPGDPTLAGEAETLAQKPEASNEHRHDHEQERTASQRAAD